MKPTLFFLFAVASLQAQTTVTAVNFDYVNYTTARVRIDISGPYSGLRLRFVKAPTSCQDGTQGTVQFAESYTGSFTLTPAFLNLYGLTPSNPGLSYNVCPEVSNDYGSTWTRGAMGTLTLPNFPGPQAYLPKPAATFSTDYPSDYADMLANHVVPSTCANWQGDLTTAVHNQGSFGTIITIPAGSRCYEQHYLDVYPTPDLQEYQTSTANVANSTIDLPAGHGFVEGGGIIMGARSGDSSTGYNELANCTPGSMTVNYARNEVGGCGYSGPLTYGLIRYVHFPNASTNPNTVQLYKFAPYGKTDQAGRAGTLCQFEDVGQGKIWFVPWPRKLHSIIIRTSTPDSQFMPIHTRISPAWASKMVAFVQSRNGPGDVHNTMLNFNSLEGRDNCALANIRFVGIQFTTDDYGPDHTSTDPLTPGLWIGMPTTVQSIFFDRCLFHGLGGSHRIYQFLSWNGVQSAIIDSYIDGMQAWRATRSGLGISGQ